MAASSANCPPTSDPADVIKCLWFKQWNEERNKRAVIEKRNRELQRRIQKLTGEEADDAGPSSNKGLSTPLVLNESGTADTNPNADAPQQISTTDDVHMQFLRSDIEKIYAVCDKQEMAVHHLTHALDQIGKVAREHIEEELRLEAEKELLKANEYRLLANIERLKGERDKALKKVEDDRERRQRKGDGRHNRDEDRRQSAASRDGGKNRKRSRSRSPHSNQRSNRRELSPPTKLKKAEIKPENQEASGSMDVPEDFVVELPLAIAEQLHRQTLELKECREQVASMKTASDVRRDRVRLEVEIELRRVHTDEKAAAVRKAVEDALRDHQQCDAVAVDNSRLKEQVDSLQTTNAEFMTETAELTDQLTAQKTTINELAKKNADLEKRYEIKRQYVNELITSLRNFQHPQCDAYLKQLDVWRERCYKLRIPYSYPPAPQRLSPKVRLAPSSPMPSPASTGSGSDQYVDEMQNKLLMRIDKLTAELDEQKRETDSVRTLATKNYAELDKSYKRLQTQTEDVKRSKVNQELAKYKKFVDDGNAALKVQLEEKRRDVINVEKQLKDAAERNDQLCSDKTQLGRDLEDLQKEKVELMADVAAKEKLIRTQSKSVQSYIDLLRSLNELINWIKGISFTTNEHIAASVAVDVGVHCPKFIKDTIEVLRQNEATERCAKQALDHQLDELKESMAQLQKDRNSSAEESQENSARLVELRRQMDEMTSERQLQEQRVMLRRNSLLNSVLWGFGASTSALPDTTTSSAGGGAALSPVEVENLTANDSIDVVAEYESLADRFVDCSNELRAANEQGRTLKKKNKKINNDLTATDNMLATANVSIAKYKTCVTELMDLTKAATIARQTNLQQMQQISLLKMNRMPANESNASQNQNAKRARSSVNAKPTMNTVVPSVSAEPGQSYSTSAAARYDDHNAFANVNAGRIFPQQMPPSQQMLPVVHRPPMVHPPLSGQQRRMEIHLQQSSSFTPGYPPGYPHPQMQYFPEQHFPFYPLPPQ